MIKKVMDMLRYGGTLGLAPVSPDSDLFSKHCLDLLPFKVWEFPSGASHNGWTIPNSWRPLEAKILRDGRTIYDGMEHPLGVVGYGTSFSGRLSLEELQQHLFYHPVLPDALVYHCDYYYKPWKRDWGFSVPRDFFNSLQQGEYDVVLTTEESPGTMKVLDYILPGEQKETIILNAHTCHAAQVNDGLSGVAVGIEAMLRLMKKEKRRYTYRFILAPEHLGTVFYLAALPEEDVCWLKNAVFLEMLGNDNRLILQESFWGTSSIDRAFWNVLSWNVPSAERAPFRSVVGNDETVWEAPGFEIPCISLSRSPYREYHSNFDSPDIIHEKLLDESVKVLLQAFEVLETDAVTERLFSGLVCLSNPQYDLYISTEDPSIRGLVSEEQKRWHYFMTCLYRYFDNETSLLDLSEKFNLPFFMVRDYVRKYCEKGLVLMNPSSLH